MRGKENLKMTENKKSTFTEKVNGVTYIVNVKSAENANVPVEEYIKDLITKEALSLLPDTA